MATNMHIDLFVEDAPPGATQPVEVERLADGTYRLLYSPGLVEGIAAGDVVRVVDPGTGGFELVSRGGNVAIKVLHDQIAAVRSFLDPRFERLGGRCDGAIEKAAVYTVPVTAGFDSIQNVMRAMVTEVAGSSWYFGNIYDADDNPLNWWLD